MISAAGKFGGELAVIVWFQRLVDDKVWERIVDDLVLARTREHALHDGLARSILWRRNWVGWANPFVNLSHSLVRCTSDT